MSAAETGLGTLTTGLVDAGATFFSSFFEASATGFFASIAGAFAAGLDANPGAFDDTGLGFGAAAAGTFLSFSDAFKFLSFGAYEDVNGFAVTGRAVFGPLEAAAVAGFVASPGTLTFDFGSGLPPLAFFSNSAICFFAFSNSAVSDAIYIFTYSSTRFFTSASIYRSIDSLISSGSPL